MNEDRTNLATPSAARSRVAFGRTSWRRRFGVGGQQRRFETLDAFGGRCGRGQFAAQTAHPGESESIGRESTAVVVVVVALVVTGHADAHVAGTAMRRIQFHVEFTGAAAGVDGEATLVVDANGAPDAAQTA